MILYFSGTGNSKYVAERIGEELQDETFNLFEKIRSCDFSEMKSSKAWVIVSPTYAWRIPRILYDWLSKVRLRGNKSIYFVMTCGGDISNAGEYVKKLSLDKGMEYMGCIPVVMPENYIALFNTPTKKEAIEIINKGEKTIKQIVRTIKNNEIYNQPKITFKNKLNSGIVNSIFYPAFVHAKKFHVTDKCISCGICEKVCVLNNISMKNGEPVWGDNCTHCMACICRCPKEAIEYGKHSKNKIRYTCPEKIDILKK